MLDLKTYRKENDGNTCEQPKANTKTFEIEPFDYLSVLQNRNPIGERLPQNWLDWRHVKHKIDPISEWATTTTVSKLERQIKKNPKKILSKHFECLYWNTFHERIGFVIPKLLTPKWQKKKPFKSSQNLTRNVGIRNHFSTFLIGESIGEYYDSW